MDSPIIILGAGGLGRAALEIFESNKNVVYGFLDDNAKIHHTEIDNIPVLGATTDEEFLKLIGKKCEAFVASDNNKEKENLTKMLIDRCQAMPTNAVHNNAQVALSVKMGHGNFINAGVTIGAGVDMANHCILHCGSTLDHSCQLADFVQIGAGAVISSNVEVGKSAFIGAGVVIVAGIKIGKNARVGAGSVVIADVANGKTVFGNPAQEVSK